MLLSKLVRLGGQTLTRSMQLHVQTSKLAAGRHFSSQTSCDSSSSSSHGPCFGLSDDQKVMLELAEKFTKEEIMPVAAHHDKTGDYPKGIIKQAHELGFLTVHIPVEYGGQGMTLLDHCMIEEKIAYGCSGIGRLLGCC